MNERRMRLRRGALEVAGWMLLVGVVFSGLRRASNSVLAPQSTLLLTILRVLLGVLCVALGFGVARLARTWRQYRRGDLDIHERVDANTGFTRDLLTRLRASPVWSQPRHRLALLAVILLPLAWVLRVLVSGVLAWANDPSSAALAGIAESALVSVAILAVGPLVLVIAMLRQGHLKDAFVKADDATIYDVTGATRLATGGNPEATRALAQASLASGLTYPPPLYVVPSSSLNAFVIGSVDRAAVGVSDGMLGCMGREELVAVFANLLARVPSGVVKSAGASYGGVLAGRPGLADPEVTLDLYAAWDDAAIIATRNPAALASALRITAAAQDTRLPGLGPQMAVFLWTAPRNGDLTDTLTLDGPGARQGESLETRRLALLAPVAGTDAS